MDICPQRNWVLVKVRPREKTDGGIYIPQNSNRKPKLAGYQVIDVGPGVWREGGFIEPRVKKGDCVVVQPAFAMITTLTRPTEVNGEQLPTDTEIAFVMDEGIVAVITGDDFGQMNSDLVGLDSCVE